MSDPDFRALFESLPGMVVALAPDFAIVAVTDGYLNAIGSRRHDTVGRNLFDASLHDADGTADLRASLTRVLATLQPDVTAARQRVVRATDGSEQITHWRSHNVPVLSAAGVLTCILHQIEDVTSVSDAKRAAEDVSRISAALDDSNQALESFTYSVAHDLRSPLLILDGLSQALIEDHADSLDATGNRHLTFIRQSAQHIAQLITGLVTLSQISRATLERESVDLSGLAHTAMTHIQSAQPERLVRLSIQPQLFDQGDPRLLTVVLHNLLHNAWKFSSKRVQSEIEFGVVAGDRPTTYFVRDNGVGFDMTYAERLFGVFQRFHRAGEFEGSGVGLAAVARIVRRHGGRAWAHAAVDQGATFYFTLNEPERAAS